MSGHDGVVVSAAAHAGCMLSELEKPGKSDWLVFLHPVLLNVSHAFLLLASAVLQTSMVSMAVARLA